MEGCTLPCSYSPLPHEPLPAESTPARHWPLPKKATLVVFSGLLMLGLFLAIIHGYRDSDHVNKLTSSMPLPSSEPLQPVSRGVSAGVSEKSNPVLAGVNVMSFPWNNTMLSWQRTAFHFQPEKNWMNGKFI